MPFKFSLVKDQLAPECYWNPYESNPYNDDALEKIKETIGDYEIPVTSIPSPFAQLHLFETAFNSIIEKYKVTNDPSVFKGNTTYHRLISECLDVYEMLFLYDTLKLAGKIKITTWDFQSRINSLKESSRDGIRTFGDVLQLYIKTYNSENRYTENGIKDPFYSFTIILYNNEALAGTSPITGFFTTGNRINVSIRTHDDRKLFKTRTPLFERDPDFQVFINMFFQSNPKAIHAFPSVYNYVKTCRNLAEKELSKRLREISVSESTDMSSDYTILYIDNNSIDILPDVRYYFRKRDEQNEQEILLQSDYRIISSRAQDFPPLALLPGLKNKNWNYIETPLSDEIVIPNEDLRPMSNRTLPGHDTIQYPYLLRNDLLSKHLIKLDYDINEDKFWSGGSQSESKNLLLPIKPDYFRYFTLDDLKQNLTITKLDYGVVVKLKMPVQADGGLGYINFERTYIDMKPEFVDDENKGAIIPVKLYMGIYPFFKVKDKAYNDYYKVVLYNFPDIKIECSFYRDDPIQDLQDVHLFDKIVRTRPEEGLGVVSTYLEISKGLDEIDKDITFDIISINVTQDQLRTEGLIIPLMEKDIELSQSESKIAFDIGTSNTYTAIQIAGSIQKLNNYKKKESGLELHQVMLHKPVLEEPTFKGSDQYDLNSLTGGYFRPTFLNEFMPSLIGDESQYNMPIRTVINQDNDTNPAHVDDVKVLSNINIPFAFGKEGMRKDYDKAFSNLKWGIADPANQANRNRLRAFIEQLVIMGRNKIISEGYSPKFTNVIWFKPLSMATAQESTFTGLWQEYYTKYFSKETEGSGRLTNITESWAPFYSYPLAFGAGESFLNIDIGGGTSDILVFKDNQPVITASLRFAGNHLFDNGLNFTQSKASSLQKDNGFVTKYTRIMEKIFADKSDEESQKIIGYFNESTELNSEDLIQHFFTIPEFSEQLRLDKDFKLLFLLHNISIFYHSAQIIKNSDAVVIPNTIGLSGNGARLLEITNMDKDLNHPKGFVSIVNHLFKHIFELEESPDIHLRMIPNPKEATSVGGIQGLDRIRLNEYADIKNFCIPLGDSSTLIMNEDYNAKKQYRFSDMKNEDNVSLTKVAENYIDFINYFFDRLWYECDLPNNFGVDKSFNPKKLTDYFTNNSRIKAVLRSAVVYKIEIESEPMLNETLFFYPLRGFLYEFSQELANESAIVKYKGLH